MLDADTALRDCQLLDERLRRRGRRVHRLQTIVQDLDVKAVVQVVDPEAGLLAERQHDRRDALQMHHLGAHRDLLRHGLPDRQRRRLGLPGEQEAELVAVGEF